MKVLELLNFNTWQNDYIYIFQFQKKKNSKLTN